jgi:hypothetical protein
MWIFGGGNGQEIPSHALWNYDPIEDKYRWVAGNASTSKEQYSFAGEKGVPGDDVFPGYIDFSAHAIDHNDNIWSYGCGSSASNKNTFWMFNTTSLQFTWIGGDESNFSPIYGELGAASAEYWPGYLEGACMVVDSKNNLWLIGGVDGGGAREGVWHYNTTFRMWSLQHGDPTSEDEYPDFENNYWPGRWMAGCTIDEEDRVWLFGGYSDYFPNYSWNDMWSFDTKTVAWRVERGFNDSSLQGNLISFDTYDVNNYPSARDLVRIVDRRDGTIMMFGGNARGAGTSVGDIWVFNKTTKLWKIVFENNSTSAESTFGEYRGLGSKLGARQDYSIEHGLTSNGHMIIFGGDDGKGLIFNEIWIIPQDQCTIGLHECDPNASCLMELWTYQCTCNAGYTGDGKTCTLIAVPSAQSPSSAPPSATPTKVSSAAALAPTALIGLLTLFW